MSSYLNTITKFCMYCGAEVRRAVSTGDRPASCYDCKQQNLKNYIKGRKGKEIVPKIKLSPEERKKHIKEYTKKHYELKKEKIKEYNKLYYQKNKNVKREYVVKSKNS